MKGGLIRATRFVPTRRTTTRAAGRFAARGNRRAVHYEQARDGFLVTTDRSRFDIDAIHDYLNREAYWSFGIPRDILMRAIERSLCFGLLEGTRQIGFTRVVTDEATFAWVCDVYVLADYRGRGLGLWMLECALAHPSMQGLRRIVLATRDAHGLYRRVGFEALPMPERWMAVAQPDVYVNADAGQ